MKHTSLAVTLCGGLASLLLWTRPACAQIPFVFDADTSSLSGSVPGAYTLDIQFVDGSSGDANNTFSLSGFQFGMGGGISGAPMLSGGVSGDVAAGVTLTDSSFFNEFLQSFTPGDRLQFAGTFTANVDAGGTPDEFTIAILDGSGAEVSTTGPNNVLMQIDLDSAAPTVFQYALTAAPQAVPETNSLLALSAGSLLTVVLLSRTRRKRQAVIRYAEVTNGNGEAI